MASTAALQDWKNDPLIVIGRRLAPLWPAIIEWREGGRNDHQALRVVLSDIARLLDHDVPAILGDIGIETAPETRRAGSRQAKDLLDLGALLSDDPDAADAWIRRHLSGAPQSLMEIFAAPFLSTVIAQRAAAEGRLDHALGELHRISRQIYFISINASVEANGAGEAGRAFAVIASEIRALSEAASAALNHVSSGGAMASDTPERPLANLSARA